MKNLGQVHLFFRFVSCGTHWDFVCYHAKSIHRCFTLFPHPAHRQKLAWRIFAHFSVISFLCASPNAWTVLLTSTYHRITCCARVIAVKMSTTRVYVNFTQVSVRQFNCRRGVYLFTVCNFMGSIYRGFSMHTQMRTGDAISNFKCTMRNMTDFHSKSPPLATNVISANVKWIKYNALNLFVDWISLESWTHDALFNSIRA